MDYTEMKKLDEESAKDLKESAGPVDECICHLFSSPDSDKKGVASSIKKALGSIVKSKRRGGGISIPGGGRSIVVPLNFDGKGNGIRTTRRALVRGSSCGKCGCDKEKFVMKDADFNIRITSPDISTICPCPTDCLPDKAKLQNNIQVTIEHSKVPDIPSSWINNQAASSSQLPNTKDQHSSTLGQTRSIKTALDQNNMIAEADAKQDTDPDVTKDNNVVLENITETFKSDE